MVMNGDASIHETSVSLDGATVSVDAEDGSCIGRFSTRLEPDAISIVYRMANDGFSRAI
jgi:hypothetical protein